MKMLLVTAQTLPLWISKQGQQPPPLCGAVPADPSYVAKVFFFVISSNALCRRIIKNLHFPS